MATIAELKERLAGLQIQKSTLEARLENLKTVRSNILNLSDEVSDVNLYYNNAKSALRTGLKGANTSLADGYDVFKQSDPLDDEKMSGAVEDIDSEISRCQTELDSCISDIDSTNTAIADAEEAEREAAKEAEKAAQQQSNQNGEGV